MGLTVGLWDAEFLSDHDVGACIIQENMLIEIFKMSFESTQNKQQYGTKITWTEERKKLW